MPALKPAELKMADCFTPKELAAKLNMSLKWVVKMTQAHRMPGQIKIGRLWRYRRVDVEKRLLAGDFLLEGDMTQKPDHVTFSPAPASAPIANRSKQWV